MYFNILFSLSQYEMMSVIKNWHCTWPSARRFALIPFIRSNNNKKNDRRLKYSIDTTLENIILHYIYLHWKKCVSGHIKYNFVESVLPTVAWWFQHFTQKHRKWTARLPLSAGCFLIAQAGTFICCTTTVGLFWGIIILPTFHVPSRDFFLQSFVKFHCLRKCWR